MRFGEDLKLKLTSEWKTEYLDYEALKGIFSRAAQNLWEHVFRKK